jgi:thiosulfate/3-mercaptopyruvate sulfurtransferase
VIKLLSRRQALMLPLLAVLRPGWAAPAESIPAGALIEPKDLAASLTSTSAAPLMLHVGFRVLYDRAHIPGSAYAGPARDAEGLKSLSARVADLQRDTALVIYCGCCPWSHCPNIAAAYQTLASLGFTHLKVLHIAENFGTDWLDKGYPTQQPP